jgi:MFS transporter, CP family, cyanate transporter
MAPLLDEISAGVGLTSVMAGLLMTVPVLCFGVFGPAAPRLAHRFGIEATLAGVLVALVIGSALRLIPTASALFGSTVLVGAGIALGNILLPGLIKRDFPNSVGLMSGVYTLGITGGAALAAGITVPLARAADLPWSVALAAWGLLAVVGLVAWFPGLRRAAGAPAGTRRGHVALGRDRLAWLVTLFFAFQSLNYYAVSSWLPTLLISYGFDAAFAGLMLSVINLAGIIPAMLAPVLVARLHRQSLVAILVGVLYAAGLTGLLFSAEATSAVPAWVVVLGIAQGASLGFGLTLIVLRAPDAEHATALSGMAQSWGYGIAAAGPLVVGALFGATGGWAAPLGFLLLMLVPQTIAGYRGGAPLFVGLPQNGRTSGRGPQ